MTNSATVYLFFFFSDVRTLDIVDVLEDKLELGRLTRHHLEASVLSRLHHGLYWVTLMLIHRHVVTHVLFKGRKLLYTLIQLTSVAFSESYYKVGQ